MGVEKSLGKIGATKAHKSRNRLVLGILGLLVALSFYFIACLMLGTSIPVAVVASDSMQPTFARGDLLLLRGAVPEQIREGDVVTISVPEADQKRYNYPSLVTHRVVGIDVGDNGLTYQTKGDATQPDPFQITPDSLRGQPWIRVPFVGNLLLFLKSKQGLMLLLGLGLIWFIYCYSGSLRARAQKLRQGVMPNLIPGTQGTPEAGTPVDVQKALGGFATAMNEYGVHLKSHTAVMQNLAQTTEQLKEVVRQQAEIIARLNAEAQGKSEERAKALAEAERLLSAASNYGILAPEEKPRNGK